MIFVVPHIPSHSERYWELSGSNTHGAGGGLAPARGGCTEIHKGGCSRIRTPKYSTVDKDASLQEFAHIR